MNNKLFLEFENYLKNFDLKNEKINEKYKHSYRVYEYVKDIANSLKLSKEDIMLAMTCGLLNDIGRFSQITEYDTTNDLISVDHGDKGYEILLENNYIYKYTEDEEEKEIILYVVKNHNKLDLEEAPNERAKTICNIVRDSTKLDILITKGLEIKDNNFKINKKYIENLKNKKLITNATSMSDIDKIIKYISFIFDINYKRTFEILIEKNTIETKLNLIKEYIDKQEFYELKQELNNYIKERLEC